MIMITSPLKVENVPIEIVESEENDDNYLFNEEEYETSPYKSPYGKDHKF